MLNIYINLRRLTCINKLKTLTYNGTLQTKFKNLEYIRGSLSFSFFSSACFDMQAFFWLINFFWTYTKLCNKEHK
jgi:hypothetical protein